MKGKTDLEYVEMYCGLVSIHCNDLMEKHCVDDDVGDIEKLSLTVSLLNSAVRSLRDFMLSTNQREGGDIEG